MVQTRLALTLLGALALCSCATPSGLLRTERFSYSWKAAQMDASRTGVKAVTGDAVQAALGAVDDAGNYTSPSGKVFDSQSSTAMAAASLMKYQDAMSPLREVIGHSAMEMPRSPSNPNTAINAWTADVIKTGVETKMGRTVDAAIMNRGGIRIDMPKGDVTVDDISSMFPFLNYLCYIEMPGYELRKLLEQFARGPFQAISGIVVTVKDGALVSAKIGGKELDDNAFYAVASVDYLLDGGDNIFLARNSRTLEISEYRVLDWIKEYVSGLTSEGKSIECTDYQRFIKL